MFVQVLYNSANMTDEIRIIPFVYAVIIILPHKSSCTLERN